MTLARFFLLITLLILLSAAGFATGAYLWFADSSSGAKLGPPVEIVVTPGMRAKDVAGILKEKGVIKSALLFRLQVFYQNAENRLKPGNYDIVPGEALDKIIQTLQEGREERFRLTIPEGLTIQQIAALVENSGACSAASFTAAITDSKLLKKVFPVWESLTTPEGLAFPETYTLPKHFSPAQIAETMLDFTHKKLEIYQEGIKQTGLSLYEACVLASIVEREGKLNKDRPLIASVFLNRLKKNIKLESCATVQYAQGFHKDRLLLVDLKIDSPFNTYLHAGLPPTPIANFGESSLAAVASPPASNYFFFVSDASEGHFFSETLAEHERSKKVFFQERRKQKKP